MNRFCLRLFAVRSAGVLLFVFVLAASGCQSSERTAPTRLASVLDFGGDVSVNGQPVVQGAVLLHTTQLAALNQGWLRVQYPGLAVLELQGPGRAKVKVAGQGLDVDLESGRLFIVTGSAGKARIKHGPMQTELQPDSNSFIDRLARNDYLCLCTGEAEIKTAAETRKLRGKEHSAVTATADGVLAPASVTRHSEADMAFLRGLIR